MNALRLAWLDFTRHRAATLVVLCSLALSVGCAGVLFRARQASAARFARIVPAQGALVGAKAGPVEMLLDCLNLEGPYPEFIPYRLYQTLVNWKPAFHEGIVPFLICGKAAGGRVMGTTEAFLRQGEWGMPVSLAQGRWAAGEGEAVMGAAAAARAGLRPGGEVAVDPWVSDDPAAQSVVPRRLRVTGVLHKRGDAWDDAVFTNLAEAQRMIEAATPGGTRDPERYVIHYMLIYLKPGGFPYLRGLVDRRTVAQAVSVPEARSALEALTGSGRSAGDVSLALILAMGGLSMAGILIARFEAKARSLAVLKALGYERASIRALLLWEGLLLGASACALGAALDALLFPWLRARMGTALPPAAVFPCPIWRSLPVWLAGFAAALAASMVHVLRAERADPRDSLQAIS